MKNLIKFIALWCFSQNASAQCTSNVPLIVLDLSANPDTSWVLNQANAPNRLGQCCGVPTNEECISFEITLHPNAAGMFFDYDGASAYGSLTWRIDCGPEYNLRDTICIADTGPFTLTFCKPGTDNGNYTLISIPKPTFPEDQTISLNCVQPLEILGVNANTPTWQSISPGAPGQYNSYLSCTDCLEAIFTPDPNGPSEIQYQVCGYPILDYCVGYYNYCDTFKITIFDSLLLSVSPNPAAFCSGESVTLTAQATGGDGNYNYIWYNSSSQIIGTGSSLEVNSAGNFTCEVRDGDYDPGFCAGIFESVTVMESLMPIVSVGVKKDVSCNGLSDGSIDVEVIGGTGPYTYLWSNGSTTQDLSGIEAGEYILTIMNGNGCSPDNDLIINVAEPELLLANSTVTTNFNGFGVSCFGKENGAIEASVTGGTLPYTYEWNTGETTENISNVGSGIYDVIITDANGCSISATSEITEPDSLVVVVTPTNVSCNGGNDGWMDVTVTGGIEPYIYEWSNGESTEDITTLSQGNYSLTVLDANNCVFVADQAVIAPTVLVVTNSITPISCFNSSDGSIDLTCDGGTAPYSYQWSNGSGTEDISNVKSGEYEVIVSDANDCWTLVSIFIDQPDSVIFNSSNTNPTCFNESNGQIEMVISGGTMPYSCQWSTGSVEPSINELSAGTYQITITDANNCVYSESVTLTQPNPLTLDLTSTVYFNNHNITFHGGNDGSISLSVGGGTENYTYTWSNGSTQANQENLSAGVYTVMIEDAQGCRIMDTIELTQPDKLELPTIYTPNEDGQNDAFDIHGIEAYPNNVLTVVNRWGNVVYEEEKYHNTWKGTHLNGEELPDGVYFVILKINGNQIERNSYVHIKRH